MARRDEDDWRQQAKNSISVRNVQPAVKTFRGDPKRAAGYLPLARTLLGDLENRLALGGVGYGARTVRLADGTLIRVAKPGGVWQIEIDARDKGEELLRLIPLFLESGFLDVRPLVPLGTPKPPATVYPTQAVEGERSSGAGPKSLCWLDWVKINESTGKFSQGEIRPYPTTGMDSLAVNSSLEMDDPDDYQNGEFVREPTSDKRYLIYNTTDREHFSSKTGKLKLWAQCRVGTQSFGGTEYEYFIQPQSISKSCGLLTTSDYRYYLIEIEDTAVYATPCVSRKTKAMKWLLKLMQDTEVSEEVRYRAESYLLAYLTLSDRQPRYALTGSLATTGNPIAYGWKFNWSGHLASIVAITPMDNHLGHHTTRLYTLTITDEEDQDGIIAPRSVNLVCEETVVCSPRSGVDVTWYPHPEWFPLMTYYFWVECGVSPTHYDLIYDTDAPIYCWYGTSEPLTTSYYAGASEQLILVRFTLEDVPRPEGVSVPEYCGPTVNASGTVQDVIYEWLVEGGGFYIDYEPLPDNLRGTVESVVNYEWGVYEGDSLTLNLAPHLAGVTNPCEINRPTGPDPGRSSVECLLRGVSGTGMYETWTGQHLYESALIIPWDSAESIYFAKSSGLRKSMYQKSDYVFNGQPNATGMSSLCVNQPQYYEYSEIKFSLAVWTKPAGGSELQESGEWYSINMNHYLYSKHGVLELLDEPFEWGSRRYTQYEGPDADPVADWTQIVARPADSYSYDGIFDPEVCTGYIWYDTPYFNLESVLGTVVCTNAEVYVGTDEDTKVTDANLPPDGADFNSMFVGWA